MVIIQFAMLARLPEGSVKIWLISQKHGMFTSSQGRNRGGGDPMAPKKPVEVPEFAKRASSIAKACRHPKHIQMSAFGSKARTN
jgi:hypothetical protein